MENETDFLRIEALCRNYGSVQALDSIDLTIHRGEFFSLLGPSGCGKTTLLRLIAGLDYPDAGHILLHGANLAAQSADKRPVNTVFQTYALFPHLTIFNNIAFGLRMRGINNTEIAQRVHAVMKLVEIEPLGSRKPHQLSGGQKQRVALARALVNEPQILLLDEPMAAIDLRLRKQLQTELRALQKRLGITFVYVTHDQEEALLMSDRVAVMNAGRIEQIGPSREIYERPRTKFVAGFMGSCNVLLGRQSMTDNRHYFDCPLGRLQLDSGDPSLRKNEGELTIAIRSEQIILTTVTGLPNTLTARITRIDYHGANSQVLLEISGQSIGLAAKETEETELRVGAEVRVQLPPHALRILKP